MWETARSAQRGQSLSLQCSSRRANSFSNTWSRTGQPRPASCRWSSPHKELGHNPSTSGASPGVHLEDLSLPSTSTSQCTTRAALERLYRSSGDLGRSLQFVPLLDPWQQGLFLVSLDDKPPKSKSQEKSPDYYANVGDAIRTLREDIPKLFEDDLNCKPGYL